MKISLCITTFRRVDMTLKSFEKVLNDERISDIHIVDDGSDVDSVTELNSKIEALNNKKIHLYWNRSNLGMSQNKYKAISLAYNDWAMILDSDNQIDVNYLNALEAEWLYESTLISKSVHENTIYCPSAALPNFDYTKYEGMVISKENAKNHIHEREFDCCMNTCNYVVNKKLYLANYRLNPEMKGSDTIWHNYNHLKAGGWMKIVPKMTYQHLVHKGSGWLADANYNTQKANEIKQLIREL